MHFPALLLDTLKQLQLIVGRAQVQRARQENPRAVLRGCMALRVGDQLGLDSVRHYYVIRELWPCFEVDEAPFMIYVTDGRYVSWTGSKQFLDLESSEKIDQLPRVAASSTAVNIDEYVRRTEEIAGDHPGNDAA